MNVQSFIFPALDGLDITDEELAECIGFDKYVRLADYAELLEQHSKACRLLAAAQPILPADAEILSNDIAIWLAANL